MKSLGAVGLHLVRVFDMRARTVHLHLLVLLFLVAACLCGRVCVVDPRDLLHQLLAILLQVGRPGARRLGVECEGVIADSVVSRIPDSCMKGLGENCEQLLDRIHGDRFSLGPYKLLSTYERLTCTDKHS